MRRGRKGRAAAVGMTRRSSAVTARPWGWAVFFADFLVRKGKKGKKGKTRITTEATENRRGLGDTEAKVKLAPEVEHQEHQRVFDAVADVVADDGSEEAAGFFAPVGVQDAEGEGI